jgi:hypothetical protein
MVVGVVMLLSKIKKYLGKGEKFCTLHHKISVRMWDELCSWLVLEHAQERAFPLLSPPLTRSHGTKEEDEQWFVDERRGRPPPACILASLLITLDSALCYTR